MIFKRTVPIIVLLSIFSLSSYGSENSDRLVKTLKIESQFKEFLDNCLRSNTKMTPEDLLLDNPNYFYGLNVDSKEWPEVVAINKKYYDSSCMYITPKEFSSAHSESYAKLLSDEELKQVIKFYMSPIGQKFLETDLLMQKEFQKTMNERASELLNAATIEFNKSLTGLYNKSKKKPWWKFW